MTVDSHCHLTLRFEQYEVETVLQSARNAGVEGVIMVGYCPVHYNATRQLLDMFGSGGGSLPALAGTIGIHPHEADKFNPHHVKAFPDQLDNPDVIAIGETGLDYFRDYADRSNQRKLFESQVDLASQKSYPLVVHSRAAFDDTIAILKNFGLPDPPGVFHCYGYGPNELEAVLEMGFHVSFAGNLTYPPAEELRESAKMTPSDRILVETDSPFLVPHKAKNRKISRCEPALVVETALKLAEIKGWDEKQARSILIQNTMTCFPKLRTLKSWSEAVNSCMEAAD